MGSAIDSLVQAPGSALVFSGAVFFTFVFVFLIAYLIAHIVQYRGEIRRRTAISQIMAVDASPGRAGNDPGERQSLRYQNISDVSATLATASKAEVDTQVEIPKARIELVKGGFFSENAVTYYQLARFGFALGIPFIFLMVTEIAFPGVKSATVLLSMGLLSAVGFLMPNVYLARRQRQLREQCRAGFPDFMDLLVVCTQAGMSPRAAIDRVSRELAHTYPYLGANLYLLSLELRAGRAFADAINNFAQRVDLEEAYSLGALLQQSEQLGTSISNALRVYSEEMRDKRMSRAEEKAHALPVKLVVPLGIYVFPVMLVVIMLPVILRVKASLF